MSKIYSVDALEVLDSRGNPTVAAYIQTEYGGLGRAIVPSGASTGEHEAVELRDCETRYLGAGVRTAVRNIQERIRPCLVGVEAAEQSQIDQILLALDGTIHKSSLGANAILAVSLAAAQASANEKQESLYRYIGGAAASLLPVPMMNILNGGKHADNSVDFQEFMILPVGAPTFSEALRMGVEVFHHLKKVLHSRGFSTSVGDEGGFAPDLKNNRQALELILEAIEAAGLHPGRDVFLGMDAASSELYDRQTKLYRLSGEERELDTDGMIRLYESLVRDFPILSIEDGLDQNDYEGHAELTRRLGDKVQLVGDDLFVTNVTRLREGIERKAGNAILIKPNQIGSLTETIETVQTAQRAGFGAVMSHRSGESEDVIIADLAVGLAAGQIKTGSLCRGERTAKYNRLLEIEKELGSSAKYAGKEAFLGRI